MKAYSFNNIYPFQFTYRNASMKCFLTIVIFICSLSANSFENNTLLVKIENKDVKPTVYLRNYFIKYNAQNALEMLQRIPGFSIKGGGKSRGFSSNAGNVLVDNARPTTKSGGLNSVLVRIPAGQVKYIEIIRGGSDKGSDTAGQSLIANIIRNQGGSNGAWDLELRRVTDGRISPELKISYATQVGNWQTSSELNVGNFPENKNALRQNYSTDKTLISETTEHKDLSKDFIIFNTELSRNTSNGKLVLNGRLEDKNTDVVTKRQTDVTNSNDEIWQLGEQSISQLAELSIDLTQKSNDWKWRLLTLGVLNIKEYNNQESAESIFQNIFTTITDDTYHEDTVNTEFIIRSTFGQITNNKLKPEIGFEVANNRLDTEVNSFAYGIADQLSNADVVVSELRAEIFANAAYQITEKLSLDGNITAEFSKLSVDGDTKSEQNFNFIKYRLITNYQYNQNHFFSFEVEKKIDQLNFNNFSSSEEASNDRETAGNPDLVPPKTSRTSLTYDWRFSNEGALKFKYFHQWKNDVLEKIILPSGEQALGNAGNAQFWGFDTDLTLPLDTVLNNSNIILSHRYKGSDFHDEIINASRTLNNRMPIKFSIKFRQDITSKMFAWGVNYFNESYVDKFEVDEIERRDRQGRFTAFIESGFIEGIKTTFTVFRINTDKQKTNRMFFEETRNGSPKGNELTYSENKFGLRLSLSSNF